MFVYIKDMNELGAKTYWLRRPTMLLACLGCDGKFKSEAQWAGLRCYPAHVDALAWMAADWVVS